MNATTGNEITGTDTTAGEAGADEADAAAERLEAALARIAGGLAKSVPARDPASASAPDTAMLAARLDELIRSVRAELAATAGVGGKTD